MALAFEIDGLVASTNASNEIRSSKQISLVNDQWVTNIAPDASVEGETSFSLQGTGNGSTTLTLLSGSTVLSVINRQSGPNTFGSVSSSFFINPVATGGGEVFRNTEIVRYDVLSSDSPLTIRYEAYGHWQSIFCRYESYDLIAAGPIGEGITHDGNGFLDINLAVRVVTV